ncbi:hypothetical protein KJS94_03030 [Flavihumibacter rivuli]|uniref:heavy-metal-associated domain-containing protein n=1 Tax=Flavihumibacter rivuli TaxID=2838156 RepID=UPI001BDE5C11|nr:hypothetical protein [Flavihumibacter rivuli]ULQ57171.1 hypothetical protein KJS94_03030 [Flavihumibacter rivuli]
MKTVSFAFSVLFVLVSTFSFAQKSTTKETVKVWGECGMCKKTIEGAAKKAGATAASWNEETKQLDITYNAKNTSNDKIQQAIAAAGYDTEKFTADDKAYENLHECCKYDRKAAAAAADAKASCCKDGQCKDCACCKDGKCTKGGDCCKDAACCKDGKCSKDGDCCKNGQHAKDGKACCSHEACGKDAAACKEKGCCKDAACCKS